MLPKLRKIAILIWSWEEIERLPPGNPGSYNEEITKDNHV
jgi:hypothetical protein